MTLTSLRSEPLPEARKPAPREYVWRAGRFQLEYPPAERDVKLRLGRQLTS